MLAALNVVVPAVPNTCQPRAAHPFLPIYHLIGNVTSDAGGKVVSVEDINDVSSVFLWAGVYHVFHQCCQNHWDHAVSRDLVHWTRLPPPIVPNMNPTGVPHPDWYDAHGSWDGSLSVPHDWNGITEPVVLMTTVEGAPPGDAAAADRPRSIRAAAATARSRSSAGMAVGMAVVRPTNASDPYLVSWTKDAANPVAFENGSAIDSPYDTPGQIWRSGDHWNFLVVGERYTTTDPTLHTWRKVAGEQWPTGEFGGQWFSPLANLADGSAPPAGSPGWMMSVGDGGKYALGDYRPANESWTTRNEGVTIDYGPDSAWEAGQFAGGRFMNIGWFNRGPPMEEEERSEEPFPHERSFAFAQGPPSAGSAGTAAGLGGCAFTTSWEVLPGYTNIYNREPTPTNVTHGTLEFVGVYGSAQACFAAVNASSGARGPFHSFTWNDYSAATAAGYKGHCWADTSFTWQNRGGAAGQTSGRGPGFPIPPPLPSAFTHDHLTGLREVAYDPKLGSLVSQPVRELVALRNGTLASERGVRVAPGTPHVVAGTGAPHADASAADVVLSIALPTMGGDDAAAVGVSVLANVSDDGGGALAPFGGVLTLVNFSAPDANGTIHALASVRTLNPCGSGSEGVAQASFPILKGETALELRVLVDRSVVEVFVMGGRAVFSKTFAPSVLYVPDTHVALQAWGDVDALAASVDVYSMGCGWTDPPYQPAP